VRRFFRCRFIRRVRRELARTAVPGETDPRRDTILKRQVAQFRPVIREMKIEN